MNVFGEKTNTKLIAKFRQFTFRRFAILALMFRPRTFTVRESPTCSPRPAATSALQRNERRAFIVPSHHFPATILRARRRRVRESYTAVAFQNPGGALPGFERSAGTSPI